jgi:hypothetical protein
MKNYNVTPYFDDFDPNKNYHRILFKPGQAVQARELTQSQTILQNQISSFASAIYSQNTPIAGGKITTNLKAEFIKLNTFYEGNAILISDFENKTITDSTGTIVARVVAYATETGNALVSGDPPTLVVTYVSGKKFSDGMSIFVQEGIVKIPKATTIGVVGGVTSIGKSSVASISEGVYYVLNGYNDITNTEGVTSQYSIGNFVKVLPQTIILEKYDNTPSARVGLNIVENTITSSSDLSLLDPATNSSNYQAPGADRYQIILELVSLSLAPGSDDNFIELLRIEDGNILKQTDNTVYSTIDDYFAKRDYESNGDYIVEDFKITAAANTAGNGDVYDLNIGKGIAYVRGYRIENQSQLKLTSNRARTTASINPNSVYIDYGNYFTVNDVSGSFDFTTVPEIDLHCVPAEQVNRSSTGEYVGTKIGTAFIRHMDYQTSMGSNTRTQIFNAHVADVNTLSFTGNTASATETTLTINDYAGRFSSTNNAYVGATMVITSGTNITDTKVISGYNGSTKTITVDPEFNITPDTTTEFAIDFSTKEIESLYEVDNSLNKIAAANINADLGKENGANSSTIYYSSGNSQLIFKNGYPYSANVLNSSYYTKQIFRNVGFSSVTNNFTLTSLTPIHFDGPMNTPIYGETFNQLFTIINRANGEILSFSNTANFATITSPTTVTFTTSVYSSIAFGLDVVASVFVSNGNNTNLVLKEKNLVVGNTTYAGTYSSVVANTVVDLAKGQTLIANAGVTSNTMSLYVSDVKRIVKILDVGSVTPTGALGSFTDVTNSFDFNNGQTDNYYNHASIRLLRGIPIPKGNLLVIYDYYSHSGGDGYFSVNSYLNSTAPELYPEIPSYTAKNGTTFLLRDCLDFRPSRLNAEEDFEWEYKTITNTNNVNIKGTLIPNVLNSFQSDYSYYLGRKDKLVLTKDSKFLVIEGTPSLKPQLPVEPDGSIVLANLTLDPYTAYVQGEGTTNSRVVIRSGRSTPANLSIDKILLKRWAKSDITDLQRQVDNLEYYTTLTLLEQKASSLQVPDANGLNRFKNGILVDDFSSFGTADTAAPNYAASINVRRKQLSSLTDIDNFQLQNPNSTRSFGTVRGTNTYSTWSLGGNKTNIFTLPFETRTLIKQQLASNIISVNPFNVATYEGIMTLNPPMDNWVNTVQPPAISITDPKMQFSQQQQGVNLLNAGDFQSIPGTTTTYSDPQAAQEFAYASQTQGLLSADQSSAVATGLASDNGYVNNTAVLPYIRSQEIIVRAKGMSINTPINCYFDGINVDRYMVTPNTIELTNTSGKFRQDDIVGFFSENVGLFFPVARVVTVYNYPNSTNVRLYVAETVNPPNTVTTTTLLNATFDINGNYQASSARGTVVFNNGALTSIHSTGVVSGVGGGFTTQSQPTPQNIFKAPNNSGYSTFLNQYGIWNNPDSQYTSSYSGSFTVSIPTTGTYTITSSADDNAIVSLDGTQILTVPGFTTTYTTTRSITAGDHTISWVANNTGYVAAFALTITDSQGNIIWNTVTPDGLNFDNIGTEYKMPGGGSYYIGASKIQLDQSASANNNYYVGATITVKSSYVYDYKFGAVYIPPFPPVWGDGDMVHAPWWQAAAARWREAYNTSQQLKNSTIKYIAVDQFEADIIAYDGATRTATIDPKDRPISISMGINSQYGVLNSKYTIKGQVGSYADSIIEGTGLPSLTTDERGQFISIFEIPGSIFTSGRRVFRIDNRTLPEDSSTATTFAEAVFTASGLQSTNITNFSPSVDSSSKLISPVNQQVYNVQNISGSTDPVAQTIIVSKDNYPNGVFLSSIKLFFAPFPGGAIPTVPVTISIVGTLNGVPNGQTLDFSTVTLNSDEINTSATPHYLDPTTYTEFIFDAPVYLQPSVLYAILVKAADSDYYLYYGEQNQVAIPSTGKALPTDTNPVNPTKIGAAPYIGALFESQNSITWTADQTKQLMFVIDQCVFDISEVPTLPFITPKGLPYRKGGSCEIMSSIDANSVSQIENKTAPTGPMHAFNLSTTDFVPTGTDIRYTYRTTLTNDYSKTALKPITPGKYGTPLQDNIYLNDGFGERILLKEDDDSFQLLATMTSSDPYVSPIISDDGISLFRIVNHVNNMGIEGENLITIVNGGTNYNANATSVTMSLPDIGSDVAVMDFVANTTTGTIEDIIITYPGSGYITTPTITITDASSNGTNAIAIVSGETSASGGNAFAKYFTKKVILTPGNDSGDLKVLYTAYKPLGSEIYVYYKILNANDSELLENQEWQLMTPITNSTAFSADRTNIIEYEVAPGIYGEGPANQISYTSTNGQTYTSFIQFAIKVVIATDDKTNVPFLTDIRAIALPSGSGV